MKEIWEIDPRKAQRRHRHPHDGLAFGLENAGGGSFIYHLGQQPSLRRLCVHLNYKNPHLYPYMEFQRFKHHPMVAELLKGGKRVAYGARAISEGWLPVDAQDGSPRRCDAGLLCRDGERAAHQGQPQRDALWEGRSRSSDQGHCKEGRSGDELSAYETEVREGAIGKDLKKRAQRQTVLVQIWPDGIAWFLVGSTCGPTRLGFSVFGTQSAWQVRRSRDRACAKHKRNRLSKTRWHAEL